MISVIVEYAIGCTLRRNYHGMFFLNRFRLSDAWISKLTIIASDNGLVHGRRHAIILINAGTLLIGPLGAIFSEILIRTFSLKKTYLKMSSAKWRPFCLGLNLLNTSFEWGFELSLTNVLTVVFHESMIVKRRGKKTLHDINLLKFNNLLETFYKTEKVPYHSTPIGIGHRSLQFNLILACD